jgi:HAD superfamily phosphoserine phosphatase-like hydrolase
MRDDFTERTIRVLAGRAAHRCCRPGCRAYTSGPHSDSTKILNVGVAAHITAASVDGPRYDPTLTSVARRSHENGIWLCQNCAKLADNDPVRYTVQVLQHWKAEAEREALYLIGQSRQAPITDNRRALAVCAFDLDGTIIQGPGFRYSWQLVWQFLGYDDAIRRKLYAKHAAGEITYDRWCEECLFYFRERRLKKEHFLEIARDVRTTGHMREALRLLKHEGIATGIISGGIDTLLETVIPDHQDLFEFVYINRFKYSNGMLVGIEPTPFDFEGKINALEIEAERRGATLQEAVFVGEGKNDAPVVEVMRQRGTGLAIAYPVHAEEVETRAHEVVEVDDLRRVANVILKRL